MIRTQIYLPEDMHRDLMLMAKNRGVNFSSLIREGIAKLKKPNQKKKTKSWKAFVGACKTKKAKLNAVKAIHDYYRYHAL